MSDKSPHWPGVDGKPGVNFGPKSGSSDETEVNPVMGEETKPSEATTTKVAPPAKPSGSAPQGQPTPPKAPRPTGRSMPTKQPSDATKPAPAAPVAMASSGGAPLWATPPAKPGPHSTHSEATEAAKPGEPPRPGLDPVKAPTVRRTRKARLRLSRVDPWSVMKTSFLFSIAFGVMMVISAAVLWSVIQGSGALDAINSTMTQLIGDSQSSFDIEVYINSGRVIGFAMVLAVVDVVILTAVSTLFAFLYNLAAAVLGGLEVTLAED